MNKILLRRSINKATFLFDKLKGNRPVLFILSYHSISDDGWRFSVRKQEFEKQMSYLCRQFTPVTVQDIENHISGKKEIIHPAFAVTFDDGYKNILTVKNICKILHIKPCVFVLSKPEQADHKILATNLPLLSIQDMIDLHSEGWKIGSHGATHRDLSVLTKKNLEKEIIDSKKDLKNMLGFDVNYFSYPKSIDKPKIVEMVKNAQYHLAFTVGDREITSRTNRLLIPRIGIDGSHNFSEFKSLYTPTTMFVRDLLRRTPWGTTV